MITLKLWDVVNRITGKELECEASDIATCQPANLKTKQGLRFQGCRVSMENGDVHYLEMTEAEVSELSTVPEAKTAEERFDDNCYDPEPDYDS